MIDKPLSDDEALRVLSSSVSLTAEANGASPGTLSVANFSFTSGSSTYTVSNGPDGTLIGTKDGQAWVNIQLGTASAYQNRIFSARAPATSPLPQDF